MANYRHFGQFHRSRQSFAGAAIAGMKFGFSLPQTDGDAKRGQ
jgi:hypothetical protein